MSLEVKTKIPEFQIHGRLIGAGHPTYFIADIAANHNGDLGKARELIWAAKEAGADAAKFQHFKAETIVSRYGFETIGRQLSHQAEWKKSVYDVYQDASVPWEWTPELKKACDEAGLHFFSAPYDLGYIDRLDAFVPAYKIGSGDITWLEAVERIANKGKPVFLATGASTLEDVARAVRTILSVNPALCLMQCNTNYTADAGNFRCIQLRVLQTYAASFPEVVLGLSDHTLGYATVLGAVALGARAVEKHFTLDRHGEGPDHGFSMEPADWRDMVDRTRELEQALGSRSKTIECNEQESALIQRRCLRVSRTLRPGDVIRREDIAPLRPVKPGAFLPYEIAEVIGKKIKNEIPCGEALMPDHLA